MPGAVNVKISWTRPGGGSAPVITSPSFLVDGTVGTLYPTTTFTATGTAPITWSVTAGTLPTGMTFSSAGVLSGTPTSTANSSITFTATNAYGSNSTSLTLTVNSATNSSPEITSYVLFSGSAGSTYSDTLTATGGNITWSIVSGSISPLTLNSSTGEITGTPSASGDLTATFRATNANGTADKRFTIKVIASGAGVSPTIQSAVSATVSAGYPFIYYIESYGNPHVYEWSVNTGTLPSWANFIQRGGDGQQALPNPYGKEGSKGGQIWGIPPANTTSSTNLTFNVTNKVSPNATTGTVTLTVAAPANSSPQIISKSLPAAKVGVAYSNQLYAVGIPSSFTWAITSANKPSWLTISSSGLMTGTPSAGDVTSGLIFTFSCTNSTGTANSQNLGFEVKSSGSKALISPNDFTYLGYYDTSLNGLDSPYTQGLAVRRVGSEVRFVTRNFAGDNFVEFSTSGKTLATSGSPASCQITSTTRTWTNSGTIPIGSSYPYLYWDSSTSKLFCNFANDYPSGSPDLATRLYTATLTDGSPGSVTGSKRLSLDNVKDRKAGTGFAPIPSSFQTAYGWGPYAAGLGGYFSLVNGSYGDAAMGLSLYAIPDPAAYPDGTSLTTSQYKVLAARGAEPFSRNLESTINYFTGELSSLPGPDGLSTWTYANRYVGGAFIDGSTKQGFIAVGYIMSGKSWYEASTVHFGGAIAEAHIFDPADFARISQGTQSSIIDPMYSNIRQLSETRVTAGDNFYNALTGQAAAFATYDNVDKILYIQVNNGSSVAYYNRIYAYSVNV